MMILLTKINKSRQELNELANRHRETVAARKIQREWRTHPRETDVKNVCGLDAVDFSFYVCLLMSPLIYHSMLL